MSSKIVYLISITTTIIFFIILAGIALHSFGDYYFLFKRISPIFVYGFLVSFKILIFQDIITNGELRQSIWYRDEDSYIKPNGRDLRLDFLRGLFIFIMIVDHIGGRSILYYVTFGNQFFTSSTEGFLLISGIVTGLVYSKVVKRDGIGSGFVKSAPRLLTLYLISISLSLMILFLGEHFNVMANKGIDLSHPLKPILNLLYFKDLYGNGQILVLYFFMFLLLPFALFLLEARKTGWLIAISTIVYLENIFFPEILFIQVHTYMSIGGIQLLFFGALILGYNNRLQNVQHKITGRWLLVPGLIFLLLIFLWNFLLNQTIFPFVNLSEKTLAFIDFFFNREFVGFGRILASITVFSFLYIFITLSWKGINKIFGWLILPLGENSLFAYTFHLIIYMLFEILSKYFSYDMHSYWLNGLFQILVVLIVWFCIKKQIFTPNAQNRKLYFSFPGLILLAIISFESFYKVPWIQT